MIDTGDRDKWAKDVVDEGGNINSPPHYNSHPAGIECIEVAEHYNFNIGNVIKYVWRAAHKGAKLEDLKKARWYLDREIERVDVHDRDE